MAFRSGERDESKAVLTRRGFLDIVGRGAAAAAFFREGFARPGRAGSRAVPARKPNIILILADDLGYAGIGLQGCADIPTPNIDSIGKNGVRFTNGYVSCPLCAPSRAGLLTGRYQQRFGFETNPGPLATAPDSYGLPREETILPERLKGLGYATGMFGKWHVGYRPELQPPRRGFDEFFGFLGGAHSYIPGGEDWNDGRIQRGDEPVEEKDYLTDALAREAAAFIGRHRAQPFFLYVPFNAVHAPMQATQKDLERFAAIKDERRRTHAAMLTALDDGVGRILDGIRASGLEEETLVVFLSDNGGPTPQTTSSNAPLRGLKGQALEGGIRVPFLMQWKGRIPAGLVDDRPVVSLDLCPTAVVAAGASIDPAWKLDGVDLLPFIAGGEKGRPHDALYWRMGPQRAVRRGDLKLVWASPADQGALYDLAADPGETRNLAQDRPADVKALRDLWGSWDKELAAPRWNAPGPLGQRQGQPPAAGQGPIRQRFDQLDKNKDGVLTKDEHPNAQVFAQMDANKDGKVTLAEARDFYLKRRR